MTMIREAIEAKIRSKRYEKQLKTENLQPIGGGGARLADEAVGGGVVDDVAGLERLEVLQQPQRCAARRAEVLSIARQEPQRHRR